MAYNTNYADLSSAPHTPVRRGADHDADILREFKRKLSEDEGYVSYFQERIRIEQTYVDSLLALHSKSVGNDKFQDEAPHPRARVTSSARRAWYDVRDYTAREVEVRKHYINSLQKEVLAQLASLKDTQARITNRIREDLKNATESYEDQVYKVQKLKRTYENKTTAHEEFKKQEQAIALQAKLLSEPPPPPTPEPKPHPYSHVHSSSVTSIQTVPGQYQSHHGSWASGLSSASDTPPHSATSSSPPPPQQASVSFQPSFQPSPTEQRGHIAGHIALSSAGGRARSGSASGLALTAEVKSKEVFQDIAAHSKRGFAAIMSRLGGDRDGEEPTPAVAEISGPAAARRGSLRHNNTLKGVKAKREAEEADKAYREGIFDLETFRLRREKLQSSAIQSLRDFNRELNAALDMSLHMFVERTYDTALNVAHSTGPIKNALTRIDIASDESLFGSRLPVVHKYAPVLYKNYYVGDCHSLIFGISLINYDFARGGQGDVPPLIVTKCIAWLNKYGLDSEGLYRLSGRQATVRRLVHAIERNEVEFNFGADDDVYSVAVVLKQYLRELPSPLFPLPHSERVKHTENRAMHLENHFSMLRARLRRLPDIHQNTFRAIIEHLNLVSMRSSTNKMDAKNLAVVLNGVVFGPDQAPTNADALTLHLQKDTVLEDIINYSDLLFQPSGDTPTNNGSGFLDASVQDHSRLSPMPSLYTDARGSSQTHLNYMPQMGGSQMGSSQTHLDYDPQTHAEFLPRDNELPPLARMNLHTLSLDDPTMHFTPDSDLSLLFDPGHIPPFMHDSVGDDFHVRPLASDDFMRSHFGLLSGLSPAPALAPSTYSALFNTLKASQETYFVVVTVDKASDSIIAAGTLLVERKFAHGGGLAGHIEDIVVSQSVQGRGLGLKLVTGLRELATSLGCYKIILDCQEVKIPFYEKCGFTLRGRQMAHYVPKTEPPPRKDSLHHRAGSLPGAGVASTNPGFEPLPEGAAEYDTVSIAETADTEDSGVTYRFPTTHTNGSTGSLGMSTVSGSSITLDTWPPSGTSGSITPNEAYTANTRV